MRAIVGDRPSVGPRASAVHLPRTEAVAPRPGTASANAGGLAGHHAADDDVEVLDRLQCQPQRGPHPVWRGVRLPCPGARRRPVPLGLSTLAGRARAARLRVSRQNVFLPNSAFEASSWPLLSMPSGSSSARPDPAPAGSRWAGPSRRARAIAAALAIVFAALTVAVVSLLWKRPRPPPPTSVEVKLIPASPAQPSGPRRQ